MNFFDLTIKYIYNNFLKVILFALLPALFFGFLSTFLSPFKVFEFIVLYPQVQVVEFLTVLYNLSPVNSLIGLLILLIGLDLIVAFITGLYSFVYSHMIEGKPDLKKTPQRIMENIYSVGINALVLIISLGLIIILMGLSVFVLHSVISGIGTTPNIINILLVTPLLVFFIILAGVFSSVLMLNISNMMIGKSNFKSSLTTSLRLFFSNAYDILFAVLIPFALISLIVAVFATTAFMPFANILGILVIIIYYPVLSMIIYLDLTPIKRKDIKQ